MKRTVSLLLLLCIAAFVGCGGDKNNNSGGGAPTIISVTPTGVSIGQKNGEGTITGTNLNGVTSVNLGDGIQVDSFNGRSATEIAFTFSVAGNAGAGPKTITVSTTNGTVSGNGMFQVLNNHVPKAAFRMDPPAGSLSTVISFDATATTDPEGNDNSYRFEFGDGASAQGKKVTHKFTTIGKYNVQLRVSDSQQGFSILVHEIEISRNSPPVAVIDIEPGLSGSTNTVFVLSGAKSKDLEGKVKGFLWELGDGKKIRDKETIEYQYSKEGTYFVNLTVYDAQGQASVPAELKLKVEKSRETACTRGTGAHRLLFGRVVAVEPGNWAVTDFGGNASCANTYHKCDDYRRADPENFYGIVDEMRDRGNGILSVHNKCPYRWPPAVGEKVFLIYKTCSQNHCP